jgi:hypothetical protein
MPFPTYRTQTPGPGPRSSGPAYSVGRKVFINCAATPRRDVTLTDDTGNVVPPALGDGLEVEILAWRPRGAGGTRYRVRCTKDGREGWVGAQELRGAARPGTERPAVAPPRPVAPARPVRDQVAEEAERKFGRRAR